MRPAAKCTEFGRSATGTPATFRTTALRDRGLGRKRTLAPREYALGLESLDRFVRAEPLWRVHQGVFAILALEPVGPRR